MQLLLTTLRKNNMVCCDENYYDSYGDRYTTTTSTAGGCSGGPGGSGGSGYSEQRVFPTDAAACDIDTDISLSLSPSAAPDMIQDAVIRLVERTFNSEIINIDDDFTSDVFKLQFLDGGFVCITKTFIEFLNHELTVCMNMSEGQLRDLILEKSDECNNQERQPQGAPDNCCSGNEPAMENDKGLNKKSERNLADELIRDLEKVQKALLEKSRKKDKPKSSLSKVYKHRHLKNKK